MSSTRRKLIQLLARDRETYISGPELAKELGISRSAIWKHMNQLKKDGYQIEGKSNVGYRFVGFPNKVSENTLQWGLETKWLGKSIIHRTTTPSTQQEAHELALKGAKHGTVVIADEQTKGVGRMNRSWDSPSEQGIWFSMILK